MWLCNLNRPHFLYNLSCLKPNDFTCHRNLSVLRLIFASSFLHSFVHPGTLQLLSTYLRIIDPLSFNASCHVAYHTSTSISFYSLSGEHFYSMVHEQKNHFGHPIKLQCTPVKGRSTLAQRVI